MKLALGDKVIYADDKRHYNFRGVVKSIQRIENRVAPHDRAFVTINPNPHGLHSVECSQELFTKVS